MESVILGISLGFVAGVSPGPLMTLVVTSTLERGFRAGVLTSLAPLLTDAPIILLSLFVLRHLPAGFVELVAAVGGLFVIWLGIRTIVDARGPQDEPKTGDDVRHVSRAVVVNVTSPHPWIFWTTVGGPILLDAWSRSPFEAVGFLASFLALLVGAKVAVARATAAGRRFLAESGYRRVLTGCGLLLVVLGSLLVWRAVVGS